MSGCGYVRAKPRERGMVLVTTLLMLIVVTLIALAMFRSFGLDEKMAGNVREKQRALNAAETAEEYAEYWLANYGSTNTIPLACSGMVVASVASAGQICTTALTSFTQQLPWTIGVSYNPTAPSTMNVTGLAASAGSYYSTPTFYITYLGPTNGGSTQIYQIDAAGYGTTPDTAAVVETTYQVQTGAKCTTCGQ
jgi:type IV pilus assembly protein PilX